MNDSNTSDRQKDPSTNGLGLTLVSFLFYHAFDKVLVVALGSFHREMGSVFGTKIRRTLFLPRPVLLIKHGDAIHRQYTAQGSADIMFFFHMKYQCYYFKQMLIEKLAIF